MARIFAALAAVGVALACGTASAQASTGFSAAFSADATTSSGLDVAVSGTASAPQLVLTNGSSAPCQVPDAALGSVVFTQVQQGGKAVQPVLAEAWFDDSIPDYLATRLHTLAPGQSLDIPMPIVSTKQTGPALETVAWSDPDSSTASLYPVEAGQPVKLTLIYAAAIVSGGNVTLCSVADTSVTATLTATGVSASGSGSQKIAGIAKKTLIYTGAGVLVLLLLVLFVFLRVRKHRNSAATKAVVILALLAAGLVHSAATAPTASAKVSVSSSSLSGAYAKCSSIFSGAGGDPSNILPTLAGPNANVQIMSANGDVNHEIHLPDGESIIFWDPSDTHAYVGGGNADACTTLYHEMDHAYQDLTGGQVRTDCWTAGPGGKLVDSGIPTTEVQATREQNMLRTNLGMPARTTYGDKPLPSGTCQPPPPNQPNKNCSGSGCGDTNGDPHLTTFEGVHYDFQGAGEFVAADDPRGGYQIQVRQQPFQGSQTVAVNTAIALDVAGDRVQVSMSTQGFLLTVNGTAQSSATLTLPNGGTIASGYSSTGETMVVTWPDSSTVTISQISIWGLHLSAQPAASHAGHLRGLLGDLGGSASTSVQTAGGTVIASPSYSTLYPAFANSWRVTAATSLFTYAPGTSTTTYTDMSFPHAPATLSSVPDLAAATSQCTNAGITDPTTLQDCEFDVGLTGETAFAAADATSQPAQAPLPPTQNGGAFGIGGGPATVTISTPGGSSALHFTGKQGQVVFVNVPRTTLPNQCGALELEDPSGHELGEGCIINGSGYIDAIALPADGTYTVLVGPTSTGTGTATVQLTQDFDQTGTITPGGPAVTTTIGQPGATSRFTFTAAPGTSVFVQVTGSTLPNQCGVPELLGPNGSLLTEGCNINGSADVDETTTKASGTYTVVIDPQALGTGTAQVKLIVDHDQSAAISVDGAPVDAAIALPGERSLLTFQGTAGQTVTVQVTDSTLPGECGDIELYGPGGAEVSDGCVINGTGSIDATKLPSTGQYTITVDPTGAGTGTAVVRLTG